MREMKKVLPVIIGLLAVTFLLVWVTKTPPLDQPDGGCPADVRVCPDGTPVGRSGKNCEFEPCPTTIKETIRIHRLDPTSGGVGQKVKIIGDNFAKETYVVRFGIGYVYNVPKVDNQTLEFRVPDGHELCAPGQTLCPGAYPQMRPGIHEVKVIGENAESNSLNFEVL